MYQDSHYRGPRRIREREKGLEKIFEKIIDENFPNMGRETVTQVQEAQTVPGGINPRRNMPRHIVIKLTKIKDKEKILKAMREKQNITYKGTPICLSAETLQARREWHDILKVSKGKTYNQEYSIEQSSHSGLMEKSKTLQTNKT